MSLSEKNAENPVSASEASCQIVRRIEAILFTASDGALVSDIAVALEMPPSVVKKELKALAENLSNAHGIEIAELGGRWFMTSAPDMNDTLERFRQADERSHVHLSKAALETLAVIAYTQPTTRGDIERIRGVRCDRAVERLLSYRLIRIAGRKKGSGSPLLYRTTPQFLKIFGLSAIADLPTVAEIDDLNRRAPVTPEPPQPPESHQMNF